VAHLGRNPFADDDRRDDDRRAVRKILIRDARKWPDGPFLEEYFLSIHRSAIDEVKLHADFPRHGKPWEISAAERTKVFELTDEIIRRFLIYLVGGKATLTEREFPVLTR
jgi:hypothetical protein